MKTRIDVLKPAPEQQEGRELSLRVTCTEIADCVAELGQPHRFGPWVPSGLKGPGSDATCRHCVHCPWVEYVLRLDVPPEAL